MTVVSNLTIQSAMEQGLTYLANHQKPTGEFRNFIASDEAMVKDRREDPSPFMTQHIVDCLMELEEEKAQTMVDRAMEFLWAERFPGGLWRFWNKSHPGVTYIPPDTDDTACINYLMQRAGRPTNQARSILLGNRNQEGIFYTWILPRPGHLRRPSTWGPLLMAARYPHRLFAFFRAGQIKPAPSHVDAVVNTNVVLLLGETTDTAASINWIRQVIDDGTEARTDRFYQSPYPLYYAIMRCGEAGIRAFDTLRPTIITRLKTALDAAEPDHMRPMHRALAVSVLAAWEPDCPQLERAISVLLRSQQADGSWPIAVLSYDGWGSADVMLRWGSEELVTGFCLEALARAKCCLNIL